MALNSALPPPPAPRMIARLADASWRRTGRSPSSVSMKMTSMSGASRWVRSARRSSPRSAAGRCGCRRADPRAAPCRCPDAPRPGSGRRAVSGFMMRPDFVHRDVFGDAHACRAGYRRPPRRSARRSSCESCRRCVGFGSTRGDQDVAAGRHALVGDLLLEIAGGLHDGLAGHDGRAAAGFAD